MTSPANLPSSERRLWTIDLNDVTVLTASGQPLPVESCVGALKGPLTVHLAPFSTTYPTGEGQ